MTILFISDLHLDARRPEIIDMFCRCLESHSSLEAIYILGDFVEYWIGDDDDAHGLDAAFNSVRAVSKSGIPIYLMHGNRDFLFGEQFAQTYGLSMLADPTVIDLYGIPTLLMHGDTLCTDDAAYQAFRTMVRNPDWQKDFLNKSLNERRTIVQQLRDTSRREMSNKSEEIMDVNQKTVESIMREYKVTRLIHGHTHRPAIHNFELDNKPAMRIVLGDWYTQTSTLTFAENGFKLSN